MAEGQTQIVRIDEGGANARILAKEVKTDFRRVESASLKVMGKFRSAEGKRMFVRYFHSLQLLVYFISVTARMKLKADDIEKVELLIQKKLEVLNSEINTAIDSVDILFQNHGITTFASYDTKPLEVEIGIISSAGRRFFEILEKIDQLMPLMQTLEIHEIITLREADIQRLAMKRSLRTLIRSVRSLSQGLRRRMNQQSAAESIAVSPIRREAIEGAGQNETLAPVQVSEHSATSSTDHTKSNQDGGDLDQSSGESTSDD